MNTPTDKAMVAAAQAATANLEGTLEVDDGAKVSRAKGNPDKGAYVQAWLWIADEDAT